MTVLDYQALEAAPVAADPFPYLVVPGVVPPAALAAVLADLPRSARGGSFPPASLRLGPTAAALTRELESKKLRATLAAKLGLDLADAPTMLTMRLHCRPRDGQIHTDSAAKRVTVLLYLDTPGMAPDRRDGWLRLLRGPGDLEDFAAEIPPGGGTLLAFPNSARAWHGHLPYSGARASLQLNYMVPGPAARSELRRHRVSAFVKSLTPA